MTDSRYKPDTVFVAIERSDGGVTIMQFVTRQYGMPPEKEGVDRKADWAREPTPENIEAEIEKARLDCVSWKLVAFEDIPESREFREAWTIDNDVVGVDMDRARNITRDRIREERAPLLGRLDVEYMKALEAGDSETAAQVAARKRVLRDATKNPAIDEAETPEELLAIGLPPLP